MPPKKLSSSFLCLTCGLNRGISSNKPTHYLRDYGDFYEMLWTLFDFMWFSIIYGCLTSRLATTKLWSVKGLVLVNVEKPAASGSCTSFQIVYRVGWIWRWYLIWAKSQIYYFDMLLKAYYFFLLLMFGNHNTVLDWYYI